MTVHRKNWLGGILILGWMFLVGCGGTPSGEKKPATVEGEGKSGQAPSKGSSTSPPQDEEHGHKPTAHGGFLVSIGSDSYHAEAVLEKGGVLKLYTFGKDETRVMEVEKQDINAYVKEKGSSESVPFLLVPKPQAGDGPGMTSLFSGEIPKDLVGKSLDITIPSLRIGKERFRLSFAYQTMEHSFPPKVVDDAEKKLYLTPGGKYTEADIKANGSVTASVKFAGIKSEHDNHPKPGDKICPISLTKANPKFSWVIDGQTYEFCCPPCVDEFVATSKEKPGQIKPANDYRQK